MSTYCIGDIQGCLSGLERLLKEIAFDPAKDRLLAVGDLVARGEDSLGVLRLLKSFGASFQTVLGNHDLHLISVYHGHGRLRKGDNVEAILQANDVDDLIAWLRQQPMLIEHGEYLIAHAGIYPWWSADMATKCARELESIIGDPSKEIFFSQMYGNEPDCWTNQLASTERLRFIANAFTRMRYVHADGRLDLRAKCHPSEHTGSSRPWFEFYNGSHQCLFGHWASLLGETLRPDVLGLDTGYVWGGRLSAIRLDDHQYFSVKAN